VETRRYTIGEVSELVGVPAHVLRQWESRIPKLKPRRNRAGRRYYLEADIQIVRRIKFLVRHEKMALERVARRIDEELSGPGVPASPDEVLDLIRHIEDQAHAMLQKLGTL